MIKTQVVGHLGRDATVNSVNGKTVINFSVAHTSTYRNTQGQKIDRTIWVNCSLWRDSLKITEFLKKGTLVYVAGEPFLNTYTNNAREVMPQLNLRVEDV
jgi:single-strand DNA-binding protein